MRGLRGVCCVRVGGRILAVLCVWAALLPCRLPAQVLANRRHAGPVAERLADEIRALERDGVTVGIHALRADSGASLFSWRQTSLFAPASNQKILTAAAALAVLGADYEFETGVELRSGTLVLRAGGDPNWITGSAHDPGTLFAGIAEDLRGRGVEAVRGVAFDDEAFPGPARPAGWPADQLAFYYCAPTGGFGVDANTFAAVVRADRGARNAALVEVVAPRVEVPLRGRIRLTDDPGRVRFSLWAKEGALRGDGRFLRGAGPRRVRGALDRPMLALRRLLEDSLADAGIAIRGDAPARTLGLRPLRTPLAPALEACLKESSNFHAEQLMRVTGLVARGEGSLAAGAEAVREVVVGLDEFASDCVVVDGSGLSRENRISPMSVARVVRASMASDREVARVFVAALPQAGVEGTMKNRFEGSRYAGAVRAKTGWIRGVSALSGVLQVRPGDLRVFSILMRYDPARNGFNKTLKAAQERFVEAIAAF